MPIYHNFPYGITATTKNDDPNYGGWTEENATFCDDGNIRNVRMNMNWHKYELTQGTIDWLRWDQQLALAARHNITVHFTLCEPPTWAIQSGTVGLPRGDFMAETMVKIYNRYNVDGHIVPNQIKIFEIMNEDPFYGETALGLSAANYAEQAFPVACALRTAGFGGPIIMVGYTHYSSVQQIHDWFTELHQSPTNFCKIIDAYNFHFYRGSLAPDISYRGKPSLDEVVTTIHDVATSFGFGDKPIWLTETGYITHSDASHDPASVVTPAVQSQYLQKILDYGRLSNGILDHVHIFTMHDSVAASIIQDGVALPAYYMFKDMVAQYPTWPRS